MLRWLLPRFFRFSQQEQFMRLLRVVAELGVGVGVAALIVVLSVMRGFDHELTKRIFQLGQDLVIFSPDIITGSTQTCPLLQQLPQSEIHAAQAFVEGEILLQRKSTDEVFSQVAKLLGVGPEWFVQAPQVTYLQAEGEDIASLSPQMQQGKVLLGADLARELWVHPDYAHELGLVAPLADVGPNGDWLPKQAITEAAALFQTGVYAFDRSRVLMDFTAAQNLLGLQARYGWRVALTHPQQAAHFAAQLKKALPNGWAVQSWEDENQRLLQALQLERRMMLMVLILVLFIATFSMMGLMYLIVLKRQREIALLRALGVSPRQSLLLFSALGARLGVRGALCGGLLAQLLVWLLHRLQLPLPASYYIQVLPADLSWWRFAEFVLLGIGLAMFASCVPAWQSRKVAAHQQLRFE